jgi:hypothetical protein
MYDFNNSIKRCTVCRDEYTSVYTEALPGLKLYVCRNCVEAAKQHFIWICMNCGRVYLRPKKLVIERIGDDELKRAYSLCEDVQIIQGIDLCIECDPKGVFDYLTPVAMEC